MIVCVFYFERLSLSNVCIPENGSLQSYKDFVETLPCTDSAETFGQHPNANVIYLTKENRLLCETLGYLQEQSNGSRADKYNDKDEQVLSRLSEIRDDVPELIDYGNVVKNIEKRTDLLDFIILQEV